MRILFKQVTLVDRESTYNNQTIDLLIDKGEIVLISKNINEAADRIIDIPNLHITNGMLDLVGSIPDPGEEFKENYQTGIEAASHGGYTHIAILPHKNAPADSKERINFIKNQANDAATKILPIGALTTGLKGENMAELYDMQQNGASAFAQDRKFLSKGNVMKTALEYAKIFDGQIISFPHDTTLDEGAEINESEVSVFMGMKGSPNISEVIGVERELNLVKYTEGKIHLACLTTAEACEILKNHKKEKRRVSASVAIQNLAFHDENLKEFDVNLKVQPPIRARKDQEKLIDSVVDGTIDCIVSNHHPQDQDAKYNEFKLAEFGALSYQNTVAQAYEILKNKLTLEDFVAIFNKNSYHVLRQKTTVIEEGQKANLTFFTLDNDTVFDEKQIVSLSKNSPYIGKKFRWKNHGIYNDGILKMI
ncbi:MAG: dihydroorotase [Flavobacteriales bacterium]|jgi:dihydroorotase|nr:dihydroorotase [Flavobacteriales bacterium]